MNARPSAFFERQFVISPTSDRTYVRHLSPTNARHPASFPTSVCHLPTNARYAKPFPNVRSATSTDCTVACDGPQRNTRLFLAGGLKMEERLLHYLIVWLLCPKGSNHAQCSETDLIVKHAITQSISLNWPHLIQTIMLKAKRLDLTPLPCPLLVSKICEYKGVDITNEHYEHVLPGHKIGDNSLRQMGFIQQGLSYIHPEDAIGSNHAQCSETDLIVKHAITQSISLNWPHLIQTIMLKAKRLDLTPLPCPLLVSKICEYKGVDITNEHYEHVLPGHKIGDNSLRQMGFIQQGLSYIHPEDAIGEQASADDDANIPMPDPTNVAGPSQIHEDYSLESLSFQSLEADLDAGASIFYL
ncbi:hypothetical protein LR48_Vigan05g104900 [Vigna angularis]|uniref:Uncharacterized protein n=1 Tax=Phaseolus angularis TaxID=3914 RepID=A0A0L9UKQ6_PHAAN|nr:hypothetical protein LR48_Vigan05g104900 [Vigna angularis]